jgi:hypothetical protein
MFFMDGTQKNEIVEDQILQNVFFSPTNIAYHFFYYHKINLHLSKSIFEQLFFFSVF